MQQIIKIALLSVVIMIPNWALASNSNFIHTHTNTPIELEFVSTNSSGIRVAAVCFLGMGDCGGGSFDTADEDMSLPAPTPEELCQNEGYITTCLSGEVADQTCPHDPNYKTCKCNICDESYVYSLEEATAQGYVDDGSCQSCEVVKYKRKDNPCSGYQTCECGGEIGADICYSGNVKKFSNCKNCCKNECVLEACPKGEICTHEACSNKYCAIGCAINYVEWCIRPTTDCGALGYIQTINDCPNKYLKCPYGESLYCIPDGNVECKIGDVLYSDWSCSTKNLTTRFPIAVVFDVQERLAVALEAESMGWGRNEECYMDSCGCSDDYVPKCDNFANGKENTRSIISSAQYSLNLLPAPAAYFCDGYKTFGTKVEDWFLPSLIQVEKLYFAKDKINNALFKLKKSPLVDGVYWTSNECGSYSSWGFDFGKGKTSDYKNSKHLVLPVMQY